MGCLILRTTTVPPEPRSTEGTDHLLRLSTPRFMKWVGVPLTAEPPSTFVVVWRRTLGELLYDGFNPWLPPHHLLGGRVWLPRSRHPRCSGEMRYVSAIPLSGHFANLDAGDTRGP